MKKLTHLLKQAWQNLKPPSTHWGFPVGVPKGAKKPEGKEKGIALLIAVMVVAMMTTFLPDMIVSAHVNSELVARQRDNVRAEYMGKSAVRLGFLLLAVDYGIDLFTAAQAQALQKKKGGLQTTDAPGDPWSILNGLPIGGETIDMLASFQEQFGLNTTLDSDVIGQVKLFEGSFILQVEDENNKINVNTCFKGRCITTIEMLKKLFNCPAERSFLESKNINPDELVFRIKDYLDQNTKADPESGFGDEDDTYRSKTPAYNAKNSHIDSVEELRMIEGWDDEVHAVFAPYLTTFPFYPEDDSNPVTKININTASREILQCLVPSVQSDEKCYENFVIQNALSQAEQTGYGIGGVNEILSKLLCHTNTVPTETSKKGRKQEDPKDLRNWFQEHSEVFRIQAEGVVGDQIKKLEVIVQRKFPSKKRQEKSIFKVLAWKLI